MNSVLLVPELFKTEGGIARILRLYLKSLCELSEVGDQVSLLALNDAKLDPAELERYSDKRLVEAKCCAGNKAKFSAEAVKMGRRADRIICGHVAQLPVAWAASKLRPGLRYFLVAHGIEVWRTFTFLERKALKGAHCVLCVSDYTRQQIIKNGDVPAERTAVISNALDPALDTSTPVPPPAGPPLILSVSRLSIADNYKGIEHLLMAMPTVLLRIPGARLRIVGKGDGLPGLQALARGLNLEDAVQFTGFRTDADLAKDLDACHLFALPSQKEGFGLVYLEAMAHGRPCLGARSGGVPEVITPETGLLVEYGDTKAIAAAIVTALSREWSFEAILERARRFSYTKLREHLGSVLSA